MKRKYLVFAMLFAVVFVSCVFAEGEQSVEKAKADAAGSTAEAMTVIVTASRIPQDIAMVPRKVDVITAAEIKTSGLQNISEVLNSINGLIIHQNGGYEGEASVFTRGAPSNETLVMVDGIPINDMLSGGANLTLIDVSTIQRLELIKGGMSSVYGADASAGVINVITGTNEGDLSKFASFGYDYGSFNHRKASLTMANRIAGLNYAVSTVDEAADGYAANSDFTKRTANINLNYNAGFLDSTFTGQYFKRAMGVPFGPFGPDLFSRQTDENYAFGLNEKFTIGPVNAKAGGYMRSANLGYQDPSYGIKSDNLKKEYEANVIFSYDIGSVISLETGYEANVKNISATNITGVKGYSNQASLISITAKLFEDTLLVNAGFRADFNSNYGNITSENFSAKYNCFDVVDVRAIFDKSFSEPTMGDLYWYEVGPTGPYYYYMAGNPFLKPEDSTNYEFSISKETANVNISAGFFKNDIKKLISWVTTPDWITTTAVNIDNASIYGAEAAIVISAGDYLTLKAAYTYMNAVDASTKDPLPYRPANEANVGIAVSLPFGTKVNITGQYSDIRYYSVYAAPLKSYYLLGASIEQEISKDIEIHLNADNILDNKSYQLAANYVMPGRSLEIGITAGF